MEILVATNNKSKIKEIKDILTEYNLKSLSELNIDCDVIEDGNTFEENAIKKAKEIALISNKICLADDSGLCIEALNGFPGVNTKRFLGKNTTDNDRNMYIINRLKNLEHKQRKAKVITCIAISNGYKSICVNGEIHGFITLQPRGTNGFGFDNIFELKNGKTLAELDPKEKNKISSRKLALEKIKYELMNF